MDLLLNGAEDVVIKDMGNAEVFITFFASEEVFSQASQSPVPSDSIGGSEILSRMGEDHVRDLLNKTVHAQVQGT